MKNNNIFYDKINNFVGNLSLKVNFESLCLIGHEETYISLEKFSFESKVYICLKLIIQ